MNKFSNYLNKLNKLISPLKKGDRGLFIYDMDHIYIPLTPPLSRGKFRCIILTISYIFLILSCFLFTSCEKDSQPLPSFVIIISDDTGWNDVGYHGSEIKTPNIDKLAQEGVELDKFYVSPTCSPTRVSLLTGKPASRFGILGPIAGKSELALPKSTITLPALLHKNGYQTAIMGKWHLGLRPEVGPKQYGFEYSYGYFHGQIDPYTHLYKHGDRTWHRNDIFVDEEGHATDLIIDEACHYVKNLPDKSKPFFLYVAFSVPHFPLQEEEKWLDMYQNIENESRRLFAASMSHMDDAIGRLLTTLQQENLEKDVILIYLSDNGAQKEWTNNKVQYDGKFTANDQLGDNRPLRGWKGELYEGGIRVPALVYSPSHLKAKQLQGVVSVHDIYPTIASRAGIPIEAALQLEGINIWSLLQGREKSQERLLYWKTSKQFALRKGDWKLVHTGASLDSGDVELFNLNDDPYEQKNLIHSNSEKLSELKMELLKQAAKDNF